MKEKLLKVISEKRNKYIIVLCVLFAIIAVCAIMEESSETAGPLKAPGAASDYRGTDYQDAINAFKDAGFTNIKTEIIDDLITGWLTKDGEIEKISIDGDSSFSEGDRFKDNAEVIITYHTFPKSDEEAEETPKLEETPSVTLSTELEKEIWKIIKNNEGKLTSIETVTAEQTGDKTVVAGVRCANKEETVKKIADEISAALIKNGNGMGAILTIAENSSEEDPPALAMVTITADGAYEITSMSESYNSARNVWIREQFSGWDGSHYELKELIKSRLNDEKSFKHIETTYIDVSDEGVRDKVNQILKSGGYAQRVEVGDLFITTEFSAKNAFNATIKNKAFGIASYENNTITLVDIG